MATYSITSEKAHREIIKVLPEGESVRDWIIAHLDMSHEPWKAERIADFKLDPCPQDGLTSVHSHE